MDETAVHSRRGLLGRGVALLGAVAALGVRTAFANDDDKDKDDDDGRGRGRGPRDDTRPDPQRPAPRARLNAFSSDVCRIADVTADFSSGNPGTDALVDGRIRLRARRGAEDDAHVGVTLRGAPAGMTYEVFLQPFLNGKARESLGNVGPTDSRGNLNARTPSPLSGNHRVGVFVLVRRGGNEDGRDEYVSCLGG
jgi:hypothetical protein